MRKLYYCLLMALSTITICGSCSSNDDDFEDIVIENVIAEGKSGTCKWTVGDSTLIVEPIEGDEGELGEWKDTGKTPWKDYKKMIKKVTFKKTVKARNCKGLFCDNINLVSADLRNLNTENMEDMSHMFANCASLTHIDLSKLNTSSATDISWMFADCVSLKSLDLSSFNTANVISIYSIFHNCLQLTYIDIRNWDTSKMQNMAWTFGRCKSLTKIDMSNMNTISLTKMECMFYECHSLTSIDFSNFNTSKVINMSYAFANCPSLKTLNLTNFVTTQADVSYLFSNANSLVKIISDSTTPSALKDETFKSLPTLGSCRLSTPKEAEETYKSVKGWRDLF